MFAVPSLLTAGAAAAALLGSAFGFFFLVSMYLQLAAGFNSLEAGFALLPMSVVSGLVSGTVTPRVVGRFGARLTLTVGLVLNAIGITLFVLPKFAPVFAALGNNLPWATRVLMGVSGFASHYWYVVAAAGIAATVAFKLWLRDPAGRYRWDKLKLKMPVVGGIVRRASLAQITRSFALTLESGVPIIQGVNMIARAAGNEYLTERVLALRDGVERGESLYRTAQTADLFTPLALQMIAIGEETGALSEMLGEVADFYEREVDHDLENLTAAIEPILIVSIGVMVLILALGVFLPLWDMAAHSGGLR